jgi:hypothetical protein
MMLFVVVVVVVDYTTLFADVEQPFVSVFVQQQLLVVAAVVVVDLKSALNVDYNE